MTDWIIYTAIAYIIINVIVFTVYFIDKKKAEKHKWRIPESTLLICAVFGVFGALTGMYKLRHKTNHPKFYITVPLILVLEIAAAVGAFIVLK